MVKNIVWLFVILLILSVTLVGCSEQLGFDDRDIAPYCNVEALKYKPEIEQNISADFAIQYRNMVIRIIELYRTISTNEDGVILLNGGVDFDVRHPLQQVTLVINYNNKLETEMSYKLSQYCADLTVYQLSRFLYTENSKQQPVNAGSKYGNTTPDNVRQAYDKAKKTLLDILTSYFQLSS